MKNSILILYFVFICAKSICTNFVDSSDVLKLTVVKGSLYAGIQPDKPEFFSEVWNVHVFGLNSNGSLNLPITSAETRGITYVEYETAFSQQTDTPVWNETFTFPSELFNDQTYIALEVFEYVKVIQKYIYYGGVQLTVGQVKQHSKQFTLNLSDDSGMLYLEWQ